MSSRFVLDSSALLVLIQDQPGAQVVEDLIAAEDTEVFLSTINLAEVLYIILRHYGQEAATQVEESIAQTPKVQIMNAFWQRVRSAAVLKAAGGLSFADCFAAGLTGELDATLVTSDPEFGRLESTGRIRVLWLR